MMRNLVIIALGTVLIAAGCGGGGREDTHAEARDSIKTTATNTFIKNPSWAKDVRLVCSVGVFPPDATSDLDVHGLQNDPSGQLTISWSAPPQQEQGTTPLDFLVDPATGDWVIRTSGDATPYAIFISDNANQESPNGGASGAVEWFPTVSDGSHNVLFDGASIACSTNIQSLIQANH